jgi:CBS domain-containing protein
MKENKRMKCSEVMTSDPTFCLTTETAFHAALLMKSEDVGPIPIVSGRETKVLKGIVTDRDLVLKVVAEARDPKTTRVEEIMTTVVATCRFDDDADKAIELMQQHQVRRIPIVDGDGQLVGIISQADVATRVDEPKKTAEVVEEISKAASTTN